jgi:hypothetical protein
MSLLAAWFWPKVSDRKNAQFAINEVFSVAGLAARLITLHSRSD